MVKLLHIGLAKCGSSFLQEEIFPRVAEKTKHDYISIWKNNFFSVHKTEINKNIFESFKNIENLLPKDFIISSESLFSKNWEFSQIEQSFENIKENFSKDTVILIVIRNPFELLNSIYCQQINSMSIVKPDKYFYVSDKEINIRVKDKFNLYNFDYSKLISLYKSYFKKVVVVKYENLKNLNFLKDIFCLDHEYIEELSKYTKKYYNRSISKFGINFILFLNNFFDVEKSNKFILKLIKSYPSNSLISKIKIYVLSQFILRGFFQTKFDRIFPYKKYNINPKFIPIDIKEKILEYDKLDF